MVDGIPYAYEYDRPDGSVFCVCPVCGVEITLATAKDFESFSGDEYADHYAAAHGDAAQAAESLIGAVVAIAAAVESARAGAPNLTAAGREAILALVGDDDSDAAHVAGCEDLDCWRCRWVVEAGGQLSLFGGAS